MSRAAHPAIAIAALSATELRLALRRGESLLATIVIPAVVLVLFTSVAILPTGGARPVDVLLPGSIAIGIIATSLVSLGITTAYDRSYGVLKRLGGAPISRAELVVGRLLAVLVVEAAQVILLLGVAGAALGWSAGPGWSPGLLVGAILLGTVAFAGLGLLIAGTLRAEAVLALANALFLALLLGGGLIVPVEQLPAPLSTVAAALPAAPLGELLRAALGHGAGSGGDLLGPAALLGGWAIVGSALAALTFHWD